MKAGGENRDLGFAFSARIKCFGAALLILAASLCFAGCAAREFFATLGFDTHDYDAEEIISEYESDGEKAEEICEMVKTLTINSVEIPEFRGTKDAISHCRDSLLCYMMNTEYAKYTGNPELLETAAKAYPHMRFSVIIPAEDFSNAAYKYFGGKEKVSNKSGNMFEYLDRIECYITAAPSQENSLTVNCISLYETENTYRFTFNCTVGEETGDDYFALIIKRDDESCYFKYVEKAES